MKTPGRRILEGWPVQQHPPAVAEAKQCWPQICTGRQKRLHAGFSLLPQLPAEVFSLHGFPGRPPYFTLRIKHTSGFDQVDPLLLRHLEPLHRTPAFAAAVEYALSGDCHIA
ncbi:hypothetical protein D3C75_968080 [compost metagenome]